MSPKSLLLPLLLALALPVQAQRSERPAFLAEALAVQIEADSAELSEERDVSVYRGNVRLTRGPLTMQGDELRIQRFPEDGRIQATLSGRPATASHLTPGDEIPVEAAALRIIYTTIEEILELKGQASIRRGPDQLEGELVRYDVAGARIQADGGKDRVRIVINPPPPAADEQARP